MAKSTNKYNRKTGRPQTVIRGAGAGDPFAPILRDFLQNPNIPYDVKGLVCEQVSRPPDWEVSIAGILATNKTVGRDRLRRMFKDAERLGHMRHIKIRDERGKILRHEYVVSDSTAQVDRVAAEILEMQSRQHPNTDFSEVDGQLATNGFSGARKPGAGTPDAKKNREEKRLRSPVLRPFSEALRGTCGRGS